jgi:transcriptional regulator with XRE-family HTH domain
MNELFLMIHKRTASDERSRLAANLRRLRIARRLSLSELARSTAISKATLSGIERARGNPTLETLAALAQALGVSIDQLLGEPESVPMQVQRIAAVAPWSAERLARRALQRIEVNGSVELFELALPAAHTHQLPPRASGSRDAALVLEGRLIAGPLERISELCEGDYAYFGADVPHTYEAAGVPTHVLVLAYTPG